MRGFLRDWRLSVFRGIDAAASLKLDIMSNFGGLELQSSAASMPRPH